MQTTYTCSQRSFSFGGMSLERQERLQLLVVGAVQPPKRHLSLLTDDIGSLKPGDLAKIYVYYGGRPYQRGEMVWISITAQSQTGCVVGVVTHDLVSIRAENLRKGSMLNFHPRHIVDVRRATKFNELMEKPAAGAG